MRTIHNLEAEIVILWLRIDRLWGYWKQREARGLAFGESYDRSSSSDYKLNGEKRLVYCTYS